MFALRTLAFVSTPISSPVASRNQQLALPAPYRRSLAMRQTPTKNSLSATAITAHNPTPNAPAAAISLPIPPSPTAALLAAASSARRHL